MGLSGIFGLKQKAAAENKADVSGEAEPLVNMLLNNKTINR